jgi:hypothetical protein
MCHSRLPVPLGHAFTDLRQFVTAALQERALRRLAHQPYRTGVIDGDKLADGPLQSCCTVIRKTRFVLQTVRPATLTPP